MWSSIVINIVISILMIYFIHSIWNYLRDTYTTKKTKDLVNSQIQKYKNMMEELQQNTNEIIEKSQEERDYINEFENLDPKSMENDLENFLSEAIASNDFTTIEL